MSGHKRANNAPPAEVVSCPGDAAFPYAIPVLAPARAVLQPSSISSGQASQPAAKWCREGRWINGMLYNNKNKVIFY